MALRPSVPSLSPPRQYDTDRQFRSIPGKSAKEDVDGLAFPSTCRLPAQLKPAVPDPENTVRREHIHRIWLNFGAMLHQVHGQCGEPGQYLGQVAFARWAEMGDDDHPHIRLGWQASEEPLQGLDASG